MHQQNHLNRKYSTLTILILGSLFLLKTTPTLGQIQGCEFPNGNMEEWHDASNLYSAFGTVDIYDFGDLPDSTILLPAHLNIHESFDNSLRISDSRALLWGFYETILNEEDLPKLHSQMRNLFGIKRSEDASVGNYAMQIGPDTLSAVADIAFNFGCTDNIPQSINLDIKRVGIAHRFTVACFIGDKAFSTFEIATKSIEQLNENIKYVAFESIEIDEENVYQTFKLPFEEISVDVAPTTISLSFFVVSNVLSNSEGHYLIDNIRFDGTVSNNEISFKKELNVYPTIFDQKLHIENDNGPLEAYVYDLIGNLITNFPVVNGHSTKNLEAIQNTGYYMIHFVDSASNIRQTFKIMKL